MHLLSLILLVFLLNPANAEIRLSSMTGYSERYNFFSNGNNSALQIFGGTSGAITSGTCTSLSSSATCNSCSAAFTPCNKTRIHNSLNLTFTFQSTTSNSLTGKPLLTYTSGAVTGVLSSNSSPLTTTGPNQPITLTVPWSTICGLADSASTSCDDANGELNVSLGVSDDNSTSLADGTEDDAISFTITVRSPVKDGVNTADGPDFDDIKTTGTTCSTTGGGICAFSLFKGDEKATIENLVLQTQGTDSTFKYVQFYCSEFGFGLITRDDECTDRVAIAGENALLNSTITGLANGTTYSFQAGMVDDAGNIGRFFQVNSAACPSGTSSCHEVTPDDVLGLFDENSCFVATAAYGSPMEKNVKTLRRFRDQVLRKTSWGQIFIKSYYTLSPTLARWIAQSSERRSTARILLTPIVFAVTAVIDYPLMTLLFLISAISTLVYYRRSRKIHGEKTA